jgi:hypothetical protein
MRTVDECRDAGDAIRVRRGVRDGAPRAPLRRIPARRVGA